MQSKTNYLAIYIVNINYYRSHRGVNLIREKKEKELADQSNDDGAAFYHNRCHNCFHLFNVLSYNRPTYYRDVCSHCTFVIGHFGPFCWPNGRDRLPLLRDTTAAYRMKGENKHRILLSSWCYLLQDYYLLSNGYNGWLTGWKMLLIEVKQKTRVYRGGLCVDSDKSK